MSEPQDFCAYIASLEARIAALEAASATAPSINFGSVTDTITGFVSTGFTPAKVLAIGEVTPIHIQPTDGGFNNVDTNNRTFTWIAVK
jgi:hypothetical protein